MATWREEFFEVPSNEMAASSNIEAIVRQTLAEAAGLALDVAMLSATAGDAARPPGLFFGTAPLTPTSGGGDNAMHGDIAALFAALANNGGGKNAAVVGASPQISRLKMAVGPLWDYPLIASTALAAGTVAVIEISSLVSGFSSTVEFATSSTGMLHMEDTAPSSDLAAAVPVKSLWQIDAIGLRSTLWASWGLRAAGHAQFVTGVTW